MAETDYETIGAQVHRWVDKSLRPAHDEVQQNWAKAALLGLASVGRRQDPNLRYIALDDSDQGKWMWVSGWYDAEGEDLDEDGEWDDDGWASCLLDDFDDYWRPYCITVDTPGFYGHPMPLWWIDVQMVLDTIEVPENFR